MFRRGKRRKTAHLDVFDAASPVPYSRAGLVVPRHGRSIVERNRLKRRLREVLRQWIVPGLDDAGLATDVLVRARREAYRAGWDQLRRELEEWLEWRCSRGSASR